MPRPRRRRGHWEVEIGQARIDPEPEMDVQTGRARNIRPVDETQLYDYGTPTPDPDDEVLEGGSIQLRDGRQFHESMDITPRRRR